MRKKYGSFMYTVQYMYGVLYSSTNTIIIIYPGSIGFRPFSLFFVSIDARICFIHTINASVIFNLTWFTAIFSIVLLYLFSTRLVSTVNNNEDVLGEELHSFDPHVKSNYFTE